MSVLALDQMLDGGLWWQALLIVLLKVVVVFVIGLVGTMFMVWFERKVIAGMQNRIGPNKAGPFGLLQTLADGIKLFFKEDLLPNRADRFVFRLAPFLAFVPAFLVWSVIPLGGDFRGGKTAWSTWLGHVTRVQLADPPIGILLVLALSSIAVYGIMLAGWSQRFEVPAARLGPGVGADGQLRGGARPEPRRRAAHHRHAVDERDRRLPGQPRRLGPRRHRLPAVHHLRDRGDRRDEPAAVRPRRGRAGARRRLQHRVLQHPLRAVLPGRVHEHDHDERHHRHAVPRRPAAGQVRQHEPGFDGTSTSRAPLEGTIWFVLKVLLFLYIYVWFRATLPRLRYDQLMDLGWKLLIPLSLGWFLLLAALQVGRDRQRLEPALVAGIARRCSLAACGAADVGAQRRPPEP